MIGHKLLVLDSRLLPISPRFRWTQVFVRSSNYRKIVKSAAPKSDKSAVKYEEASDVAALLSEVKDGDASLCLNYVLYRSIDLTYI